MLKIKTLITTVTSPYSMAIQIKKWYLSNTNVGLYLNNKREYILENSSEEMEGKRLISEFRYVGRWTHKMVKHDIEGLRLVYPIKVEVKY